MEVSVTEDAALPVCVVFRVDLIEDYSSHACMVEEFVISLPINKYCLSDMITFLVGLQEPANPVPGNLYADYTSSSPMTKKKDDAEDFVFIGSLVSNADMEGLQESCPDIRTLKTLLENVSLWPACLKEFKRHKEALILHNGEVCYRKGVNLVYVVTLQFLVEVLLIVHREISHISWHQHMFGTQ